MEINITPVIEFILRKFSGMKRKRDNLTPVVTHSLWVGSTIFELANIPVEDRVIGAIVGYLHDIVEDTDTSIEELYEVIRKTGLSEKQTMKTMLLIEQCTFPDGTTEYERIMNNPDNYPSGIFWLVKSLDKYHNLFGSVEYFAKHRIKNRLEMYIKLNVLQRWKS